MTENKSNYLLIKMDETVPYTGANYTMELSIPLALIQENFAEDLDSKEGKAVLLESLEGFEINPGEIAGKHSDIYFDNFTFSFTDHSIALTSTLDEDHMAFMLSCALYDYVGLDIDEGEILEIVTEELPLGNGNINFEVKGASGVNFFTDLDLAFKAFKEAIKNGEAPVLTTKERVNNQ